MNYVCAGKVYNENSRLIGYKIADENGQEREVPTGKLKNAIKTGQITVSNLELTDNRLKVYKRYQLLIWEDFVENEELKYKTTVKELKYKKGTQIWLGSYDYRDCKLRIIDGDKSSDIDLGAEKLLSKYKYTRKRTYIPNECGFFGAWYEYTVHVDKNTAIGFDACQLYYGYDQDNTRIIFL